MSYERARAVRKPEETYGLYVLLQVFLFFRVFVR